MCGVLGVSDLAIAHAKRRCQAFGPEDPAAGVRVTPRRDAHALRSAKAPTQLGLQGTCRAGGGLNETPKLVLKRVEAHTLQAHFLEIDGILTNSGTGSECTRTASQCISTTASLNVPPFIGIGRLQTGINTFPEMSASSMSIAIGRGK